MKVSAAWLQGYFKEPLPDAEALADALTFHAAEIDEIAGDLLDVNVLPDRAAYMLSHRGVASELAAAIPQALARDPLREELPAYPATDRLAISIDEPETCARYMLALVTGVTVGPSPAWLKEALESVGQRSINNIVDATNYVMLDIGQPLHAYDANKLTARENGFAIKVRASMEGECIETLTGERYELPEDVLLITDAHASEAPLGIAGIKGGKAAEITDATTDIIIESGSFDGTRVRKTAQSLKLFTDASSRFQNRPSRALAAYGMRDVLALIEKIAGGTLVGVADEYPEIPEIIPVSVSLSRVNELLGGLFSFEDVQSAFDRLRFSYSYAEETFTVLPPFERNDIRIAEDLVEEVGRILGYDRIVPAPLPLQKIAPEQSRFRGIEAIKDFLVDRGFSEISTPSFAAEGDIELANPLQEDRPFLRASLLPMLRDALDRAQLAAPRVLGPSRFVKLFEVGTVFTKSGEALLLSMGISDLSGTASAGALKENVATLEQELLRIPASARYSLDGNMMELNLEKLNLEKLGEEYAPVSVRLSRFRPYSVYPFALRDVAVWTPEGTMESEVVNLVLKEAGEFLVRIDLFDRFEKDGKVSYAFRLVFEAMDRTLADSDLDPAMKRITDALNGVDGWKVR